MIKNLVRAAVIGSFIFGTASSFAAVQTFGPDLQKFSVDVPDGWQAVTRAEGVQLISADQQNSVDIQVQPNPQKVPLKQIVDAIAAKLAGSEVESMDENVYLIKTEVDGTRVGMTVIGDEDKYAAITLTGNDAEVLNKLLDSVDFK